MAHPAGSVSYTPAGGFAFPRSYIKHIVLNVNDDNDNVVLTDNIFTIYSDAFPNIVQFIELYDPFMAWSSNAYTLDKLVVAYWYIISPSPTEYPNAGLNCRFGWDEGVGGMVISLTKDLANTRLLYSLPGGAGGYWLDPVPG